MLCFYSKAPTRAEAKPETEVGMMSIERRIRALEARLLSDPVVLIFGDGSSRELHGRGDFLLRLFCGASGGADLTPWQAEQLELIRRSVSAQEPGGGCMTEVLRCLLNGPVEERESTAIEGISGHKAPTDLRPESSLKHD